MRASDAKGLKDPFYRHYGDYCAEREVRWNALMIIARVHVLAGKPKSPDRLTAVETLCQLLRVNNTDITLQQSGIAYDKIRDAAGLYRLR